MVIATENHHRVPVSAGPPESAAPNIKAWREYQSMAERLARQLKAVAEALPDSPISDPPEHHS